MAVGVTTTVRVAPDPPSANAAAVLGTSAVFADTAVTVRLAAAVSASPTVKAMGPVAASSAMVMAEMAEIVGAVPPPTVWRKLASVLAALLMESALLCCATVPVTAPE